MYNLFEDVMTGETSKHISMDAQPAPGELVCETVFKLEGDFTQLYQVEQVIHTGVATAHIFVRKVKSNLLPKNGN